MENFSTPPRAVLPWLANLATLAVVALAIGWSSGQRPDPDAATLSMKAPAAPQAAPVSDRSPDAVPGRWPAQSVATPIDGMQTIGFVPGKLR